MRAAEPFGGLEGRRRDGTAASADGRKKADWDGRKKERPSQ
jgi:hypothetical protein